MSDAPGTNSDAYFVGKRQLLEWVNSFLELDVKRIEDLGTGWAHCQIIDALFPGEIKMARVLFNPKHDYEYVANFKHIQKVFTKYKIMKPLNVDRLVKLKYQDNFEFLQWMKSFFDNRYDGALYDAVGRRKGKLRAPTPSKKKQKSEGKSSIPRHVVKTGSSSNLPSVKKPSTPVKIKRNVAPRIRTSVVQTRTTYGKTKEMEDEIETLKKEKQELEEKLEDVTKEKLTTTQELEQKLTEETKSKTALEKEVEELTKKIESMVPRENLEKEVSEKLGIAEVKDAMEKKSAELEQEKVKLSEALQERENSIEKITNELEESKKLATKHDVDLKLLRKQFDEAKISNAKAIEELEGLLEGKSSALTDAQNKASDLSVNLEGTLPLACWGVTAVQPTAKNLKVLKIAVHTIDSKFATNNEDTHLLVSVVDDNGIVLGQCARTPANALRAPLYVVIGEKDEKAPPHYIFLQLKHAKHKKKVGIKMSELGFTFTELDHLYNWMSKSTENPKTLQLYKKPCDFTRDPANIKNFGSQILKIAFENLE